VSGLVQRPLSQQIILLQAIVDYYAPLGPNASAAQLAIVNDITARINTLLGGQTLAEDAPLQFMVNRFARRTLVGAVSRYGDAIVQIVSETVKRWDARTVTDRIEGAVGRDLQFIRINGTLVGGLVGVLIHAVDMLL
jgi:uncharacterized membrane-anchored protein YjiN (DUF445 family)